VTVVGQLDLRPQALRVLARLQFESDPGITQLECLREPTFDGGPPIKNLNQRIAELRRAGYSIPQPVDGRYRLDPHNQAPAHDDQRPGPEVSAAPTASRAPAGVPDRPPARAPEASSSVYDPFSDWS
jgi:hypothetical protein